MTTTSDFDDTFRSTRASLHHLAIHVVARARAQATGRFSLRVAAGGFGTPDFGESLRRVRISGTHLVAEADAPGAAAARAIALDGATLADVAAVAGVDLVAPLDVGHDTTEVGDHHTRLTVDPVAAATLADWFQLSAAALDLLVASLPDGAEPTPPRLWPEHFDVAVEVVCRPGVRANFGGLGGRRLP